MSFQAMTWATEQELPAMQKIVLLMMANRTNHDTGYCFPSHDLLAKECGMEKRSVINQIAKLECAGLIQVIRSKSDKKTNNVNKYILKLNVHIKKLGSERDSLPGERDSLPGERDSLGGSERDSRKPVTIEPVKEPVKEPKESAIAQPPQKKKLSESKKVKEPITREWVPSERCLVLLGKAGIDSGFANSLVEEFILYWEERGDKRAGWDATFLGFVKRESERKRPVFYQAKKQIERPVYEYTPSNSVFDSMKTIEGEVI